MTFLKLFRLSGFPQAAPQERRQCAPLATALRLGYRHAIIEAMANRYGEAALMAVRMETCGKVLTPVERWQDAVGRLYATTPAAQRKSGPRQAFLGLCEAGLVQGIPVGQYSPSNRNKTYALAAVELLRAGTHKTVTQLWAAVADGEAIAHASQMDVVLALWKNDLVTGL